MQVYLKRDPMNRESSTVSRLNAHAFAQLVALQAFGQFCRLMVRNPQNLYGSSVENVATRSANDSSDLSTDVFSYVALSYPEVDLFGFRLFVRSHLQFAHIPKASRSVGDQSNPGPTDETRDYSFRACPK